MKTESSGHAPSASLTYEPYYGLREKPFSLSSDPRFLYTGPSHVAAFEQLHAGIRRREGLIVLTGEIGTGKTTLCRGVLGALDRRTFTTFVRDPFLSREDLLKTLLIDFGVMSVDDLKSGRLSGATRPDLSYPLYEFLDSLVPLQAFAVLIIDEAQNLSHSLLEEIRILSELEAREKLLQVVLVGQPELKEQLTLPQLRQVDQRVSVRCELSPLPVDEVGQYIAHRLGVASVGEPAVEFTREAARLVWRASGGVPRVINLVCDRSLHRGFVTKANHIDAAIVFGAVQELGRTLAPEAVADIDSPARAGGQAAAPRPAPSVMPDQAAASIVHADAPATLVSPAIVPHTTSAVHGSRRAAPTAERDARFEGSAIAAVKHARGAPAPARDAERRLPPAEGDPLAEFSHEADLASPHGRGWKAFVAAAAVLVTLTIGGSWYWTWPSGAARLESTGVPAGVPSSASSRQAPLPAGDVDATVSGQPVPPAAESPVLPAPSPSVDDDEGVSRPRYAIQVASFQSRERARRLLDELSAEGYLAEALDVDLGPRGTWRQVIVGRYDSAEAADADLAAIRERPSYDDARVVAVSEP